MMSCHRHNRRGIDRRRRGGYDYRTAGDGRNGARSWWSVSRRSISWNSVAAGHRGYRAGSRRHVGGSIDWNTRTLRRGNTGRWNSRGFFGAGSVHWATRADGCDRAARCRRDICRWHCNVRAGCCSGSRGWSIHVRRGAVGWRRSCSVRGACEA